MNVRRVIPGWRPALIVSLAPVLILAGACERKDEGTGGKPAAPVDSFQLPKVDVGDLPDGLQKRIQTVRDAAELSPRNPEHIGTLGAIYFVHGFTDAAIQCFTRAEKLAPESAHWYYYAGLAYERTRKLEEAAQQYEQALDLDANYGPFYVKLARVLIGSDPARARDLCRRALELNPKDATALLVLGLATAAGGDLKSGEELVARSLKILPDYREAHIAMARILKKQQREEEARRQMELAKRGRSPVLGDDILEALQRRGLHFGVLLHYAALTIDAGEYEEAEKILTLAGDVDTSGIATHRALATLRIRQDRLDEAVEAYRWVLEHDPTATIPRIDLADVLARKGDVSQAEKEYHGVLKSHPDDHYAVDHYSAFLVGQKRFDDAEKLWRDILKRRPDDLWANLRLGNVLADAGKNDEARKQLGLCLKLDPKNAGARWSLGLLASRGGDVAEARKQWNAIIKDTPDFIQAYMALAELDLGQKDYSAAVSRLREGLKRDSQSARMANTLAWILATCPDDAQRDGDEAVRWADVACNVTNRRQHAFLDTLAAAFAEQGRFDDAAKVIDQAIRLLPAKSESPEADKTRTQYEQRRKLYQEKKPYRDTP